MNACPELKTQVGDAAYQGLRTHDCPCRAGEYSQKPVPQRLHHASAGSRDLGPYERVVLLEQLAPTRVSGLRCPLRGIHEIGEKHRGEHSIRPPDGTGPGQ